MRTTQRLAGFLLVCLVAAGCNGIQPNPMSPTVETPTIAATALRLTVLAGELPIGGGTTELLIETVGGGIAAANVTVQLSVDEGELAASEVTTDRTGHARTRWTGTKPATLTGASGSLTATAPILVAQPVVFPDPPRPPRPPRPPAPDPPSPPPPPALTVTLSADPRQVLVLQPTTFTARVANLNAGEVVLAYQWDWEGTGTFTPDETSAGNTRTHAYTDDGIKAARVLIQTSSGRSTTGGTQVFVVLP